MTGGPAPSGGMTRTRESAASGVGPPASRRTSHRDLSEHEDPARVVLGDRDGDLTHAPVDERETPGELVGEPLRRLSNGPDGPDQRQHDVALGIDDDLAAEIVALPDDHFEDVTDSERVLGLLREHRRHRTEGEVRGDHHHQQAKCQALPHGRCSLSPGGGVGERSPTATGEIPRSSNRCDARVPASPRISQSLRAVPLDPVWPSACNDPRRVCPRVPRGSPWAPLRRSSCIP
jgi:hypothetical protein